MSSFLPFVNRFWFFLALPFVSFVAKGSSVDSVNIYSKAMKRELPCTIILPQNYSSAIANFPVVYLLHGYGGWHSNWIIRVPQLAALADSFQMIIVCPEGGYNSWYFDSPLQPVSQVASFVGREVPQYVDANFRTIKSKAGRAICGLSMGGHGALYLAMRFPETFGMAGSMSGALNLMNSKGNKDITQLIGDSTHWDNYSVLQRMDSVNVKNLPMMIDCGVDDALISSNRSLHQKLLEQKVPHTYIESAGGHNWDYWRKSIRFQLYFFASYFSAIKK